MILFREEHVAPILTGTKTQTRRLGRRRWNIGAIHACYTRPPFAKGGAEPFCRVRILDVRGQLLTSISPADALAEGYPDVPAFLQSFWCINAARLGPRSDDALFVWVVTFSLWES